MFKPFFCLLLLMTKLSFGGEFPLQNFSPNFSPNYSLDEILNYSKNAQNWLNYINHENGTNLDLASVKQEETKTTILDYKNPRIIGVDSLRKDFNFFLTSAPSEIVHPLLDPSLFTSKIPLASTQKFLLELKKANLIYQNALRYKKAEPMLHWYLLEAMYDVRGYLFLKDLNDKLLLEEKLKLFPTHSQEEKTQMLTWLMSLCKNGDFDPSDCQSELNNAQKKARLYSFYQRFNRYGQNIYSLFFNFRKKNEEIKKEEAKFVVSFNPTNNQETDQWIKQTLESYWQIIEIRFFEDPNNITLTFKENASAHVDEIGGKNIVLNSSYPISSTHQTWTLAHEFGHILGFRDCYLEFYDQRLKSLVYYEMDDANIMCSRNGHVLSQHIELLNTHYK